MKKYKFIIITLLIISLLSMMMYHKNRRDVKKYTYEELSEMSATELYSVFIENGLEVNEDLNHISKVQMEEIFKREFPGLADGDGFIMSAKGWREFRQDAKVIYEKIKK